MRFRNALRLFAAGLTIALSATVVFAQNTDAADNALRLTSKTFENGQTFPLSMINNMVANGMNACSINGAPGGNQSPQLSWSGAPYGTRTFAVIMFDVTASFTHWGMYNIAGTTTSLPENAGVAGSPFGPQIVNDFFIGARYDGPCPPANVAPFVHQYVFTLYALDTSLTLAGSANFPANAETLYQALIDAGRHGHILAAAKLSGVYSTTPSAH